MPNYARWRQAGGCYFFTVTTVHRRGQVLTRHVDRLRNAFRQVQSRHRFSINAIVILPDHLHCIWTLPTEDDRFSMRWRLVKSTFSRSLQGYEAATPSRKNKGERGLWQRRFWEHLIRDETDFERHVDYIHYNPVKHGYVTRPLDWPFSSFHRYVKQGVYPADWGAAGVSLEVPYDPS